MGGALSRLTSRILPRGIILLYHRVAEGTRDPQLLCVSPENFAAQMQVLRSAYRPGSLRALSEAGWLNPWPSRTAVVTFDDGYADNLLNAKPILQRYDIPATVFVASGFVGTRQVPYWDELAHLLLRSPSLPSRLDLALKGGLTSWDFTCEPPVESSWTVLQGSTLARQNAYMVLCAHLRLSPPSEREHLMTELRNWSGDIGTKTAPDRFMTPGELRQLTGDGLIEIGAHTMTHPNLALLPESEQRLEIARGRARLEEMAGRPVRSFAYPYGCRDNYTSSTIGIVKKEGFACACSNFGGAVWFGSDRYQLPRVLVRNWSADEFASKIAGYFR